MDKHRTLVPSIASSMHSVVGIREHQEENPPPIGAGAVYCIVGRGGERGRPIREGTAAFRHNQQSGYATIQLQFGVGEVFEGESIVPILHRLAELVHDAIGALKSK